MSEGAPGGGAGKHSNLRMRVVSALVLGAVVLGVTVIGGVAFRLFAVVTAGLIFYEWMTMRPAVSRSHEVVAWVLLIAALLVLLAGLSAPLVFAALAAGCLLALAHSAFSGGGVWSGAGIAYAGVPAVALSFLRGVDEAGLIAVLFLFAVVWATDILAYFTGRALGGPKLAPAISPGKTWSGAAGGALGGVVAGLAVVWLAATALSPLWAGLVALVLSVVSQVGDLFESAVKRRHGVKDSSALIPGHGGVMDRVDGLVVAAVIFYVLGALYSGVDTPAASFFSH
ncbi:phosphatidate cytidylyltransferase [Chelativorans salis]|uniref:Phosphatidate cytidylyltransferase n=1 Tax=Chelativorans salis TaxID=2978478 RepID=A0ABT2LP73_9HYPH|nr:phosphatidate cytidylyltransferase [Chelativorans sp. EGI FJ00035]MCT7375642.1 phosphatidate cytidylyltransferase [Chelativorans sp. EGI FJ00035]